MRINSISSLWSANRAVNKKEYVQNPILKNNTQDVFVKSSEQPSKTNSEIPFTGYNVFMIDGGNHAQFLKRFINAINCDANIKLYPTEHAPDAKYNKYLKNVEDRLNYLNRYSLISKDSYVALPVSVTVPLQNLAEQYKQVMGNFIHLTAETVQTQKSRIMNFLKVLYDEPDKYRKYIRYMDPENQGLEFTYGIIQEINKLNAKRTYIPVAKPQEKNITWLAGQRGETPELENFLATGYDKDGKVNNMMQYLKQKEWYDFNLLTLSNADVVNMKKLDGTDHLLSAYDTTIKDGARGVYNLSPIRENGKLIGYSFNDTVTNQYPYEEFPFNKELEKISKFVGLSTDEAVATDEQTALFRQALQKGAVNADFDNKLYPVWKLFTEEELINNKIYDRGDFVDSSLQNYFRRNGDYKIIYPKADAESSGRPSVMPLRSGDFAIFSALSRDVDNNRCYDLLIDDHVDLMNGIHGRLENALSARNYKDYPKVEDYLVKALEYIDMMGGLDRNSITHMRVYKYLAEAKHHNGDYIGANGLYNSYLNNLCKNYLENPEYIEYGGEDHSRKYIIETFRNLSDIAARRGEYFPSKYCNLAADEVEKGTKLGEEIIQRRANDDINIGDLFA